jgi:hypothetical protein
MWTEYTLYYLTARCTRTFDVYHINRTNISSPRSFYGLSVWWKTDWTSYTRQHLTELIQHGLEWREKEMNRSQGRTINDSSQITRYLFTVLQGRQYVNPNQYHYLFYPHFRTFLKRQYRMQQLVNILDKMTAQLVT